MRQVVDMKDRCAFGSMEVGKGKQLPYRSAGSRTQEARAVEANGHLVTHFLFRHGGTACRTDETSRRGGRQVAGWGLQRQELTTGLFGLMSWASRKTTKDGAAR